MPAPGNGNIAAEEITYQEGKKLAVISAALNICIAALKFFLYLFSGSSAILAETVHSLTDTAGSLLVIGGIYLSGKKSEQFPWGLYKVENIVALFSAGLIFVSAYEIAKVIYHPSPAMRNLDVTLIVLISMTAPAILFSHYEGKKAKTLNFPSLIADAGHWRTNIAPLIIVACGIAGARLSYPVTDRISAFIILLIVLQSGYGILRDSVKSLLDASVDKTTLDRIRTILKGFPAVKEVVSLNARNSGRFIFMAANIRLSSKKLRDAHAIADGIEAEIKRQIPFMERVIIHYEPEKKEYRRYAVPLQNIEGEISEHFGAAHFIGLWDERVQDGRVENRKILENPFAGVEKGKGMEVAKFLVEQEVDVLYIKKRFEGKGPQYVFSDAAIEVRITDLKSMNDLIELKRDTSLKE